MHSNSACCATCWVSHGNSGETIHVQEIKELRWLSSLKRWRKCSREFSTVGLGGGSQTGANTFEDACFHLCVLWGNLNTVAGRKKKDAGEGREGHVKSLPVKHWTSWIIISTYFKARYQEENNNNKKSLMATNPTAVEYFGLMRGLGSRNFSADLKIMKHEDDRTAAKRPDKSWHLISLIRLRYPMSLRMLLATRLFVRVGDRVTKNTKKVQRERE